MVQDRIIPDMISSLELERPRLAPILPKWDHGIEMEALSKPFYEPLREASLKHLTKDGLSPGHDRSWKT